MKVTAIGSTITFTFDGEPTVVFNAADARQHYEKAMMHGFEQKIRDAAAIPRKQKDGTVITVTEKMRHEAVVAIVQHLTTSSDWNTRTAVPKQNAAIAALAARLGIPYAEAEARIANAALDELMA